MILLVLQAKYNPFPDLPFAGDLSAPAICE